MTSIVDNGYIIPYEYDRRRKLDDGDKAKIRQLRTDDPKKWSYQALADEFGVSKRLIIFVIHPEKRINNVKLRQARGYKTETAKQTIYMRRYRQHKRKLLEKGLLVRANGTT